MAGLSSAEDCSENDSETTAGASRGTTVITAPDAAPMGPTMGPTPISDELVSDPALALADGDQTRNDQQPGRAEHRDPDPAHLEQRCDTGEEQ